MPEQLPCEFCGDLVISQLYMQHAIRCGQALARENDDDNDDHDMNGMACDDTNDEVDYIRYNHQVHRTNLRDFIQTHGSSPQSYESASMLIQSIRSPVFGRSPTGGTFNKPNSNTDMASLVLIEVESLPETLDADVCPICQSEFRELICNKQRLVRVACCHVFCYECIARWLSGHQTCPVCITKLGKIE